MKVLGWVVVGALIVAGLLGLDPSLVGLSETTPVLQAIALRGVLAVAGVGLGVLLVLVAVALRKTAGRGRRLFVLGLVALVIGLGHGGVLLERGAEPGAALPTRPDDAVDVLTLNTLGVAAGTDAVVELIEEVTPDVVALQETPPEDAQRIADQLDGRFQVFTDTTGPQPVQGTALLVSHALGEYLQAEAPATTFGGVWARPADGDGPELLSVHPVPPVPGNTATWRAELAVLTDLCERLQGVVMAGDLNATVDHATLREAACLDGSVGVGGVGTWPAGRPALLGTAIDHVLVDPERWQAVGARVLEPPGAGDHRALLVRLVPAT